MANVCWNRVVRGMVFADFDLESCEAKFFSNGDGTISSKISANRV